MLGLGKKKNKKQHAANNGAQFNCQAFAINTLLFMVDSYLLLLFVMFIEKKFVNEAIKLFFAKRS